MPGAFLGINLWRVTGGTVLILFVQCFGFEAGMPGKGQTEHRRDHEEPQGWCRDA